MMMAMMKFHDIKEKIRIIIKQKQVENTQKIKQHSQAYAHTRHTCFIFLVRVRFVCGMWDIVWLCHFSLNKERNILKFACFVCLLSKQIKRELCERESKKTEKERKKSISCDAIWRYINRKKRHKWWRQWQWWWRWWWWSRRLGYFSS